MSNFSFRNYFKNHIVEDTPVAGDFDVWHPTLRTGVSTRSQANDVYLFKDIATELNITIQNAVDIIAQRLYDKLFPNNAPNPANSEEEYRQAIFDALTSVITEINRDHNINIKNAKSQKAYTSRIISRLGQVVKTFDDVRPQTARAAIRSANQQIVQEEPETENVEADTQFNDVDKLKTRLFKDGYGNGLELTPNISKKLYGIKDPGSITLNTKLKFLKSAIEQAKNIERTTTSVAERGVKLTKLNNFYGGIFERKTIGQNLDNKYFGRERHEITCIKENVLRFNFTYQEAVENKLLSSSGIRFIQHLTARYNATPVNFFKHFTQTSSEGAPFIFNCVLISTITGHIIYYTEHQRFNSKSGATSRSIVCPKEYMSISRFYSVETRGGWGNANTLRRFNLLPPQ